MSDPLIDAMVRRLAVLNRDERRVIEFVMRRLELGRQRYGELDLATAKFRERRERAEEWIDWFVYAVCEELVLEDEAHRRSQAEAVG